MKLHGKFLKVEGERIYVTRGIYDYFDEKNFIRLLDEYKSVKKIDEESGTDTAFYIGLYGNDLIERTGKIRKLKDKVTDEDRVNLLEALDFVDGAFIIKTLDKEDIISRLGHRILQKKDKTVEEEEPVKDYEIGYASGAFSNLHKGHVEHLKEMKRRCKTTIVAANSDTLIHNYKNKTSSVSEQTRRLILSHIRYVDMAIITSEYDKLKALERVKQLCGTYFDAIFVGSDWKDNPKWKELEDKLSEMGIDVVFTDRPQNGISTTAIDATKKKKSKFDGNR